jgi:hypothetical protein
MTPSPREGDTEASALDDATVDVCFPFHRRACGRPAWCSADFLRRESMIIRVRVAGGGEQGRLAGTSEEREQVTF